MCKITIFQFLTVLQFPNSFLEGIAGFDRRLQVSCCANPALQYAVSVRCARARKRCTLSQDRAAACLPSSLPFSLPIFFGRIVKKERAREEGLESFGHHPPSILVNSLGKLVLLVVHIRILFIFIIRLLSSSC